MTGELRRAERAFQQAVDMAARGRGDAHERLVTAYEARLVTLRPEALPPPARARCLALHDQVCGTPPGGRPGDYTATFRALDPAHAAELLARLVELKNALRLLLEEQEG